jgi:hypothetical protein
VGRGEPGVTSQSEPDTLQGRRRQHDPQRAIGSWIGTSIGNAAAMQSAAAYP